MKFKQKIAKDVCDYCETLMCSLFLKGTTTLRVQGSMATKPTRGNCRRGKENEEEAVDDTPLPKRKCISAKKLIFVHPEVKELASG